jgi:cell division protein FtsB
MRKLDVKKRILFLALISVLLLLLPIGKAKADEIGELKQQITEQNQKLQELMERLEQLEARQKQKDKALTEKIEEVAQKKETFTLPDSLKWAEKVKISGDFRYRHERIDEEKTGSGVRWKAGRDRDRIRARLMIDAMVNDDWGLGFRLASGSGDPASTNQTLEDSFSSKPLWLDLAYFDWHPAARKGLNVFGGKVKNPFYKVGGNQLIWDDDLNPEGIAANYCVPLNDRDELYINGGGFWVDESSSGVDTSLWGAQGYFKHKIGNPDYILGGVSYFDYGNIQGRGDLQSTWSSTSNFFGNTTSSGLFASDFDIFEAFAEYGTKLMGLPFTVFGDWAKNLVASNSEDTAWLIGGKFNKAKDPGSWEVGYNYRELEADSVLGAFTDSDFIGGGTDGKGHQFGFTYQLAKNLQASVTYFNSERDGTTGRSLDYRRLQLDLKLKF